MSSLARKRCLVTGGSRGIGLAIAQRFAREGAHITLVGRNPSTLADAVRTLDSSAHGDGATAPHGFLAFDVADAEAWRVSVREPPAPAAAAQDTSVKPTIAPAS